MVTKEMLLKLGSKIKTKGFKFETKKNIWNIVSECSFINGDESISKS